MGDAVGDIIAIGQTLIGVTTNASYQS